MPKDNYETIVHPLEPCFTKDSKILILGSFPSVKTREYGFFYGHPQNRFWRVMEILFKEDFDNGIATRKDFLSRKKIALYDSIYQCDIVASSDASIKNAQPSDLSRIIKGADIKEVFLNGATSYKYYKKYHEKDLGLEGVKLPSTSPANARYSLDDLVSEWRVILKYLD